MGGSIRGLTLIETMLSLGLLALVVALVANLLVGLGQVNRRVNELSWKGAALAILDRIELDGHSALGTNLAEGTEGPLLEFTLRDVSDPNFLPDSPDPTWSVDLASIQRKVAYQVEETSLQRLVSRGGSLTNSTSLGEAETFEAARTANGTFILTLDNGRDSLRKEFRSLCLRSLAAPL